MILSRGYAFMTACYADISPDIKGDGPGLSAPASPDHLIIKTNITFFLHFLPGRFQHAVTEAAVAFKLFIFFMSNIFYNIIPALSVIDCFVDVIRIQIDKTQFTFKFIDVIGL